MTGFRRFLGILIVVSMPPAVLFWFFVHPLIDMWRRAGPAVTYTIVTSLCLAVAVVAYLARDPLLGQDLGPSVALGSLGLVLYVLAAVIQWRCRRYLTLRLLVGLPEIASPSQRGRLLQDGIYGVVRHPRYLAVILGTLGAALVVNHAGVYIVSVALVPALAIVIVLEERELATRFGHEYEEYRARVPAILPRWPRTSGKPR